MKLGANITPKLRLQNDYYIYCDLDVGPQRKINRAHKSNRIVGEGSGDACSYLYSTISGPMAYDLFSLLSYYDRDENSSSNKLNNKWY